MLQNMVVKMNNMMKMTNGVMDAKKMSRAITEFQVNTEMARNNQEII